MLRKPVSRTAKSSQELPVAGPGPHLDHVLDHDPPGRDRAGIPHDLECEIAAPVRARTRSAGTTVVRALRRCQEQVDPAHLLDDPARLLPLDGSHADPGRGKVVGEDLGGQIPGVGAAHDRRAGRCRAVAASAQPAEDVVGPDHRPVSSRRLTGSYPVPDGAARFSVRSAPTSVEGRGRRSGGPEARRPPRSRTPRR